LYSIRNIRTGEGEILKSPSDAAIVSRVSDCDTISRELGMGIHRCTARLVVAHASTVKNIEHILTLGEKQAVLIALNTDAKEMVKLSHVRHREFLAESCDNPLKKTHGGSRQNNVINI
jgi:hypothetical protein